MGNGLINLWVSLLIFFSKIKPIWLTVFWLDFGKGADLVGLLGLPNIITFLLNLVMPYTGADLIGKNKISQAKKGKYICKNEILEEIFCGPAGLPQRLYNFGGRNVMKNYV